jgi:hypothetical protein
MRQKLRVHIEDKYLKMPEYLDTDFPYYAHPSASRLLPVLSVVHARE